MIYTGLFTSAESALNYFAIKRSFNNWGVTNPSQRRYVTHFCDVIVNGVKPHLRYRRLVSAFIHTVPKFDYGGTGPYIQVSNIGKNGVEEILYLSAKR